MKKVYEIVKYNLIGTVLFTCKERPDLEVRPDPKNPNQEIFVEKDTGREAMKSNLWEYSTKPKAGAFDPDEKFLPYFAKVTEDVPQWVLKKNWQKTYDNCQLMTEKHGGYLQFWHEPTKQVLRIAMNSHIYEPIGKKA